MNALLIGPENPHFIGHLRTLQVLDEVRAIHLAACVPQDMALLEQARRDYPDKVASLNASPEQGLGQPVDVVVACPRNDRALAVCKAVFAARKPMLAEKPIGRGLSETAQAVALARAAGVSLGVFYTNRAHPAAQAARDFVHAGLLGDLMHVEMRWFTTQPKFRDIEHWLFKREMSGGGILNWLGCHLLDLAHYVSGVEITSAGGAIGTRSGEPIDVEDVAAVHVQFENGAVGSLACGYVLAQSGGGYYNRAGNDGHIAFVGTLGRVWWQPTASPSVVHMESAHPAWRHAPRRELKFDVPESPAYGGRSGEDFVRAFLRGEPVATGDDALRVARLLRRVYGGAEGA